MNCTVIPSRDCDRASQLAAHLDRARRWHIEYGGFLSNHLAHNHVVFAAAGADERLHAWWEDLYAGCLDQGPARASGDLIPRPAPDPATRIDARRARPPRGWPQLGQGALPTHRQRPPSDGCD